MPQKTPFRSKGLCSVSSSSSSSCPNCFLSCFFRLNRRCRSSPFDSRPKSRRELRRGSSLIETATTNTWRTVSNDRPPMWSHLSFDISVMNSKVEERKYGPENVERNPWPVHPLRLLQATIFECDVKGSVTRPVIKSVKRLQPRGEGVLTDRRGPPNCYQSISHRCNRCGDGHSRPQSPLFFWSALIITTAGWFQNTTLLLKLRSLKQ